LNNPPEDTAMKAWIDFFTTDYGVLSALSIGAMLAGLGYFVWFVSKHVREDSERYDREHGRA
jgi:Protein of unknown function (DUF3149)